jgi:hypothetical protein
VDSGKRAGSSLAAIGYHAQHGRGAVIRKKSE